MFPGVTDHTVTNHQRSMQQPAVCGTKLDLLRTWSQAVKARAKVVRGLDGAERTQSKEALEALTRCERVKAAYLAHIGKHGCDR